MKYRKITNDDIGLIKRILQSRIFLELSVKQYNTETIRINYSKNFYFISNKFGTFFYTENEFNQVLKNYQIEDGWEANFI